MITTPTPPAEVDVAERAAYVSEDHPVIQAIIGVRQARLARDIRTMDASIDEARMRSARFEAADDAIIECANAVRPALLLAAEQVASLRKALAPFAAVAEHDIGDNESDDDLFRPMSVRHAKAPLIQVGHLRDARSALGAAP